MSMTSPRLRIAAATACLGVASVAAPVGSATVSASASAQGFMKAPAASLVAPAVAPSLAPFVHRTNASWSTVTDSQGMAWEPRAGFVGGSSVTQRLLGLDVARTVDDTLFSVSTLDATGFSVAVPRTGTYRVRLLMAEGYHTKPGQRVFDVRAGDATLFSGVDIVRWAGAKTALVRSALVTVTNGRLDLDFVTRVDRPSVAAVEVVEEPAAQSMLPPTGADPSDTTSPSDPQPTPAAALAVGVWKQSLVDAPLDPFSAQIAQHLRRQVVDHWNGVAALNAFQYNGSIYTVPADQPRIDVSFWDCQNKGAVPPNLSDGKAYFRSVPVPDNALPAAGTDAAMTVYDPTADQAWEFWKMRRDASTGGWEACWGGRIDQVSTSLGIFDSPYGASASGLLMAGGVITLDDVRRGRINHALYLGVITAQAYPAVSWPAMRGDGNVADIYAPREGQRLRLDPSLDLNAYQLTPIGRMVAEAAQKYGFIVSDRSGAVAVITESGAPEQAVSGVNPWTALIGGPTYTVMANFPWDRIQVVAQDWGRPAA